jgi:hypothetical protein
VKILATIERAIWRRSGLSFVAAILAAATLCAGSGQESLQPTAPDEVFYKAYRAADPITRWPSDRLHHEFPELSGLKPAADPAALPVILKSASESAETFMQGFANTSSVETIDENRLDSAAHGSVALLPGFRETVEQTRGGAPGEVHVRERFRYLLIRSGESGIEEYRTDLDGNPAYDHMPTDTIRTAGFASLPLCFSLEQQPLTDFRYLGVQDLRRHSVVVIAFAQHPVPAAVIGRLTLFGPSVPILLQGIAWLDPAGAIIQIRTELLAPQPLVNLNRVATCVVYAKTELPPSSAPLWLPKEAEVHIKAFGHDYVNRHHYADYQAFVVKHKVLAVPSSAGLPQ